MVHQRVTPDTFGQATAGAGEGLNPQKSPSPVALEGDMLEKPETPLLSSFLQCLFLLRGASGTER